MIEPAKIKKLLGELRRGKLIRFPQKGYIVPPEVPNKQGVYVIYDPKKKPVHVGRTVRGKKGLGQRLNNHLLGQSSFVQSYLKGHGKDLRGRFWFQYLEVLDDRERALLESLGIGTLCPEHLGLGRSKKETRALQ
ncbi:MAG TPA: GIY-YIG nuclease family protein [Candidatus Paceibacterota bacterium]|nr:GIY-YIG nuclease family protein [Candidatus Paceibacterota bacterium]